MKLIPYVLCTLVILSCSKNDGPGDPIVEVKKSAEKSLITFGFTNVENPSLIDNCTGIIQGNNVTITLPSNIDFTVLKATFTSSPESTVKIGNTVQQDKITVNNFSDPVTYTIVAADGSQQNYTVSITKGAQAVAPLIKSKWQTFSYPLNAYFPYDSSSKNSVNGHEGNACGPTALAKILHYMQYPSNGVGKFDYNQWNMQWICDLTTLNLNYANMPNQLSSTDPESTYKDAAKLMLASGVASYYVKIWAANVTAELVPGLIQYFSLDPGLKVVNRWEVSREEWINTMKNELLNGRPFMVAGRTTSSPAPWGSGSVAGHWFNVDGFNAEGKFHVLVNYGKIEGYYDADDLTGSEGYTAYNSAVIGFKKK